MWPRLLVAALLLLAAQHALGQGNACWNEQCEKCTADYVGCKKCRDGYYVDASRFCAPCKDKWAATCTANRTLTCNTADYYTNPSPLLYLDPKTGICKAWCTAPGAFSGCTRCNADGRCTECGDFASTQGATVLDPKSGKCVKCKDELCGKCDPAKPSKCYQCQKEPYWSYWGEDYGMVYRDEKSGACESCMHTIEKGCLACNGRGECTNCKKGGLTILRDGRCVPCSAFIANCRLCSANGKTCKQCAIGFGFKGGACVKCPEGCDDCEQARQGSCLVCSRDGAGYYFDGKGFCKKMPDGCSTVNKDGSCRACFDGYKMVSGKCLRCRDSACIACDSDACERTARSHCGADGFCSNCTELWPGISASCRWW
ncbi:hypothetical protein CHLNCDRAFT_54721 [Chlorella variabilis]|uniref:TNFR-Cys domain-containing protein n=1 Tax=Chlorella variabilis TaxID=554065 RepID=E1ZPS8_CHLVA|nr:hypothetical protein CHLNCDRAFT_54721 [Chlorella variabilis]EFN52118.1 hypothetical protein CHLNCDRAFT_54721 [Chlorella variabilis]|eukprot:XP_005844220.1 hypothetical protein CHLNCDRAFT_54721 [Chlorella variabilis]